MKRIENQVEMEKNKVITDEIRAAHGKARTRNKSEDNAAHDTPTEETKQHKNSQNSQDSENALKISAQDDLEDPEVDKAFFYAAPQREE